MHFNTYILTTFDFLEYELQPLFTVITCECRILTMAVHIMEQRVGGRRMRRENCGDGGVWEVRSVQTANSHSSSSHRKVTRKKARWKRRTSVVRLDFWRDNKKGSRIGGVGKGKGGRIARERGEVRYLTLITFCFRRVLSQRLFTCAMLTV